MAVLPTGTVTFLCTDIEGSTRLLEQLRERYSEVLADHRRLLRAAFHERSGHEVDTQGDAFFVAFPRARDAISAAVEAQRAVSAHTWPNGAVVRVRMGLHTGEPLHGETGYTGMDVHRAARLSAAGHGGQVLLSEATRALVEDDLPEGVALKDLGEHRLKDLTRPQHLFQLVTAGLQSDFPPLRSLDILPNNLPRQLTSFVGREREIADVKQRLAGASLLTLTGSGGCGKTRLALQVAADLTDTYRDGVWLVELASVSDGGLVPQTVASTLNLREQSGRPVTAALTDYLEPRHLLIVLDNCEHVLAACAELVEALLRRCSQISVLATSREAFGLAGEATFRVPSLTLPESRRLPPENLMQYEAVRLFADRAVLTQPGFVISDRNAGTVAQICRLLDGVPLAIELAAARVKVLTIEQIATRLDDRFRLLTGGLRAALPRHQTLRAAMDWSYDLLPEPEKMLLQRLSVFAGGCTLEAAEAVCSGQGVDAAEVLDLLARLVDKSLVLVDTEAGGARYRLLETVRQYGRDRLEEASGAAATQARHLGWYVTLAERAEPKLREPGSRVWVQRLEAEHENIRAALAWTKAGGDIEAGLRLAGALFYFWFAVGYWNEGRRWLEDLLAEARGASPSAVARALRGAAFFAWRQADEARATTLAQRGLALARALGDKETMAWMFLNMGSAAMRRDDLAAATKLFEDGLGLAREHKDGWLASVLLAQLGVAARLSHEYERAVAIQMESLALLGDVNDAPLRGYFVRNLGVIALWRGDLTQASVSFAESLALCRDAGYPWVVYEGLVGLAGVAAGLGRYERAARLYGVAEALRELIGHIPTPADQADYDLRVASTRSALGDMQYVTAFGQGRVMTLEQAIDYALDSAGG